MLKISEYKIQFAAEDAMTSVAGTVSGAAASTPFHKKAFLNLPFLANFYKITGMSGTYYYYYYHF